MQIALSRIWTWLLEAISYNDNDYNNRVSLFQRCGANKNLAVIYCF